MPRAKAENSALSSLGSSVDFAKPPNFRAFKDDRRFPAGVLGPELRCAFCRFAAICFSLVIYYIQGLHRPCWFLLNGYVSTGLELASTGYSTIEQESIGDACS